MKDDDLATKELPNVDSLLENDQNKPDSQVSQPKTYSELEIVDPTLPLSDLVEFIQLLKTQLLRLLGYLCRDFHKWIKYL